jgi:hypothetical protein
VVHFVNGIRATELDMMGLVCGSLISMVMAVMITSGFLRKARPLHT